VISSTDYLVKQEEGVVTRLQGGYPCHWYGQTIVVVYDAGFTEVPPELKAAAMSYSRGLLAEAGRDPFVKSEGKDIPGVYSHRVDYWVGSIPGQVSEGPVPDIVAGQLKRFRNMVIA
jgi:hypothetical protein